MIENNAFTESYIAFEGGSAPKPVNILTFGASQRRAGRAELEAETARQTLSNMEACHAVNDDVRRACPGATADRLRGAVVPRLRAAVQPSVRST